MDAEATPKQLIEATKEIISSRYTPAQKTTENSRLLTTAQVQEKINEFSALQVNPYVIFTAMKEAGFRISGVGEKFYWVLEEK